MSAEAAVAMNTDEGAAAAPANKEQGRYHMFKRTEYTTNTPAPDCQPDMIMTLPVDSFLRMMRYLSVEPYSLRLLGQDKKIRAIFLALGKEHDHLPFGSQARKEAVWAVFKRISEDVVVEIIRATMRIYLCFEVIQGVSLEDFYGGAEMNALPADSLVRLQAFPRLSQDMIGSRWVDNGKFAFKFTPRFHECTHVVDLVPYNGRIFHAVSPKHVFAAIIEGKGIFDAKQSKDESNKEGSTSRAFFKLREVCARESLTLAPTTRCIDVGAAPGGWSQYLRDQHVAFVVAVDPGALTIPSVRVTSENVDSVEKTGILHVMQRVEDSGDIFAKVGPFNFLCCDMNTPHPVTINLLKQLLPFMSDDAMYVVTIKMMSKGGLGKVIDEVRLGLFAIGLFPYRAVHLFSNKKQEFTVLCRKALPTDSVTAGGQDIEGDGGGEEPPAKISSL